MLPATAAPLGPAFQRNQQEEVQAGVSAGRTVCMGNMCLGPELGGSTIAHGKLTCERHQMGHECLMSHLMSHCHFMSHGQL